MTKLEEQNKKVEEARAKYATKKKVRRFTRNTIGKDYVVGDIHGCFSMVQARLDEIGFNVAKDRLFCVGDLVDRGKESMLALEWLEKNWFHSVLGNHELMAIQFVNDNWCRENYIANGGKWLVKLAKSNQIKFAEAFDKLPIVIEVETKDGLVGIIHAHCPYNDWYKIILGVNECDERMQTELVWNRDRILYKDNTVIKGIHKVYHGHTPTQGKVFLGNRHYIDIGAVFGSGLIIEEI